MSYILFYSNYCKYSEKFITILEKTGEANFFAKICVDKLQGESKRPPIVYKYDVKEVPTIIVENRKLSGREAFSWLKSRIENSQQTLPSVGSRDVKPEINQRFTGDESTGVKPFFDGASPGSFSESFMIIGDVHDTSIITAETDDDINKKSKYGISDIPIIPVCDKGQESGSQSDSLKTKQFDNEYNRLLQERNNI